MHAISPATCEDGPACAVHGQAPGQGGHADGRRAPELSRRDQGHRRRRWRRQRGQPDDRRRPEGRRVHRCQHRRPGAVDERRRPQAGHRPRLDPRARRRERPGGRTFGRRGAQRGDRGDGEGRRHGVHHRRRRRRDGNRRGSGDRRDLPRPRRPDRRGRHPAVLVRGSPPRRPGRHRRAAPEGEGRHAHRHPQRPPAHGGQRQDQRAQRVQDGRRGAAPGRVGHHQPDHHPGADQHRLRRRQDGPVAGRFGADGHRPGEWRRASGGRRQGGDLQPAAGVGDRRCRAACCSTSPARRAWGCSR